jgi:hypothetical protein
MTIKIAEAFSRRPGHRSPEDGEFSGEKFLTEILEPAYRNAVSSHEALVVDLDGAAGYSTSFLEASFGGLARLHPNDDVLMHIHLVSTVEPYLIDEITLYVAEAKESKEPSLSV